MPYLCCFLIICGWTSSIAQSIKINEVVAANTQLEDADGDTPDWIELYNSSSDSLNLQGFRLSDQSDFSTAWTFPATILPPQAYLLLFASDKDIREQVGYEAVITHGDIWQYHIPNSNILGWQNLGFDDSDWTEGATGIGYADGDDETLVPTGSIAVYVRKTFELSDLASVEQVLLHIDYDDSFVAYLNGTEIARANIGMPEEQIAYNRTANTDREALMYQGGAPELYTIDMPADFLVEGSNVLAIEVHNISNNSSDMSLIPYLTLLRRNYMSDTFPAILDLPATQLHTDFKLNSGGETLSLFRPDGTLEDQLGFDSLKRDISFGRAPDGEDTLRFFSNPTPLAPNIGPSYSEIILDQIHFSDSTGSYAQGIYIQLSGGDASYEIRYTIDGTEPNIQSSLYDSPISLSQTTLLKANLFKADHLSPSSSHQVYFIDDASNLATISIATDPAYFWDRDSGIYVLGDEYEDDLPFWGANFWEDWERPIYLSFLDETGTLQYQSGAGVKIFGGWSRANEQKSLSLFARSRYGDEPFDYPFFTDRPYDSYEALILRNSGNDWLRSMIRDGMMTGLMRGSHVDIQAYRPTRVFLNGEYWGIHNLREKINEHYLASLHGIDPDSVDILEFNGNTIYGDNSDYWALLDFLNSHDLSIETNYEQVEAQIDMQNYIQYQVAQIFFGNTDWPGNNIKYWKVKGGKWRWILFDTDFGFAIWDPGNVFHNTLEYALDAEGPGWPNPPWSTFLFRKLTENESFRHAFINQYADELNSRFLPQQINKRIDSLSGNISSEMIRHMDRWDGNINNWQDNIARLHNFADQRSVLARNQILSTFELPSMQLIHLNNEEADKGSIQINSLRIQEDSWSGIYFQEVPIQITAIPESGYTFDRWTGDVNSTEASLSLDLFQETSITAHFSPIDSANLEPLPTLIVINEINYHAADSFDTGDWVELINASDEAVDLSQWVLKDGEDDHRFLIPRPTMLEPDSFLVICRDKEAFSERLPDVSVQIGDMDFGLSRTGEAIRLFDAAGALVDSVSYLSVSPWPTEPDGTGATLALRSPFLDNALPQSWKSSLQAGTPGAANDSDTLIIDPIPPVDPPSEPALFTYPNPFSDDLHVVIRGYEFSEIYFEIYSPIGQKVFERREVYVIPNTKELLLELSDLNNGLYILRMTTDQGRYDFPIVKRG